MFRVDRNDNVLYPTALTDSKNKSLNRENVLGIHGQAEGNPAYFKWPGWTSCTLVECAKLYHTLFIYFSLSLDQFRKHLTCWLHTFLMGAVNAFQVPAYFSFLSCKVLDQYLSINCTFQPIQQRNGGEKWCSTHTFSLQIHKYVSYQHIPGSKEVPLHVV